MRRAWRTEAVLSVVGTLVFLGSCVAGDARARSDTVDVERATPVMGTLLGVRVTAADTAVAIAAADAGRRAVLRVDSLMSTYRDASELSALARRAGTGEWTTLSPWTADVVGSALDLARRSGGAFDPTVGPLGRAWGFHDGRPHRPTAEVLALARAAVGWEHVEKDASGSRARLLRPGASVDLGAIAKGFALDRAAEAMRQVGATSGSVDLGGNVLVFGPPPAGEAAWVLGVRHPRRPGALVASMSLRSGSVATSGDYEQMFEAGGVRYSHVFDPRSGLPARGVASVTVAAERGMTADALSTVLFVLGPEEGSRFLEREFPGGGVLVVWVRDPGASPLDVDDVVVAGCLEGASLELREPPGDASTGCGP